MTRQQAIDAFCKSCIYDDEEDGTWRQQVKACDIQSCALHRYRPMPYKVRSQAVQPDSGVLGGSGMGSSVAFHVQTLGGEK